MSYKIPINEIGPISMTMPICARAPEPPSADLGTFSVGVVTIDGNAWFVAADVCRALGLTLTSGAVNHTTYFGAGKKQTVQAQTLASRKGPQDVTHILGHPQHCRAHQRRQAPQADHALRQARRPRPSGPGARDVLPAIREDGAYVKGQGEAERPEPEWPGAMPSADVVFLLKPASCPIRR